VEVDINIWQALPPLLAMSPCSERRPLPTLQF
jgi:hypothetical protein